jgi:hypothetical protein
MVHLELPWVRGKLHLLILYILKSLYFFAENYHPIVQTMEMEKSRKSENVGKLTSSPEFLSPHPTPLPIIFKT